MVEELSPAEEEKTPSREPLPSPRHGAVLAGGCLWVPAVLGALLPQQPQWAPPWHRISSQGRDLRGTAVPMGSCQPSEGRAGRENPACRHGVPAAKHCSCPPLQSQGCGVT